jgi:hypothetical protein
MSNTIDTLLKDEITIDDDIDFDSESNVGKEYIFYNPHGHPNEMYSFSSAIEDIGLVQDRVLENNTKVMLLSDPEKIHHSKYGDIVVAKVFYYEGMWVRFDCLHTIDQ